PHVRSLADEVEEKLKAEEALQPRVEGYRSNSWILLDYGNVVVHVFTQEARDFYDLDRLWADGAKVDWQSEE
ncbi:ribosome silencing factor, partial [Neglectibacter timonensis]|uniref:ribosome silencing factor n=1 Tax=Neglectibacter timonensis TaxID=1776382 RepID=UPI003AB478D4